MISKPFDNKANDKAKRGDVFIKKSNDSSHIGIVTGYNSKTNEYTTIEGNTPPNLSAYDCCIVLHAYQKILGVTADDIFGSGSKAAVVTLKAGSTGNAVHIMQGILHCRGFNPNGVDGTFGSGTTTAVKNFQSSKELTADGYAGKDTMYTLYN